MTRERARIRRLGKAGLIAVTVSVPILAVLTSCADTADSELAQLKQGGYTNIRVVDGVKRPFTFETRVNGCTFQLFISQDKDVWTAVLIQAANGTSPVAVVVSPADKVDQLKASPQVQAFCPP